MIYVNYKNGVVLQAPEMLIIDGKEVWFPTDEQYKAYGYYQAVFTDVPIADEGYHAEAFWTVDDGIAYEHWKIVEDEVYPEEILSIILGGES